MHISSHLIFINAIRSPTRQICVHMVLCSHYFTLYMIYCQHKAYKFIIIYNIIFTGIIFFSTETFPPCPPPPKPQVCGHASGTLCTEDCR